MSKKDLSKDEMKKVKGGFNVHHTDEEEKEPDHGSENTGDHGDVDHKEEETKEH